MPPIRYEKTPPTADDVSLEPSFIANVNPADGDDNMVVFSIGQEDAYKFAQDIERNENGNINLSEVRRELVRVAERLNPISRELYVRGVGGFIELQLKSK